MFTTVVVANARMDGGNSGIEARDKMRSWADLNGDNLRIQVCGSVITVGLG